MIVDACTRVWHGAEAWATRLGVIPATSAEHAAAMDGVGVAFVLGYRCDRVGAHTPVERVAAWVQHAPEARLGFGAIDPTAESAPDDLAQVRELGLAGVTMAPADCACRPTDFRCQRVLEWCAKAGLAVMVSNPGMRAPESVLDFARPAHFDDALREIPNLRIVFGDIGRAFGDEALAMIAKHAGAYAELSSLARQTMMLHQMLMAAHEQDVLSKLLLGSGFPAEKPQRVIERIFGLTSFAGPGGWAGVPREALRSLIERDALPLLGLEHWPSGARRASRPDGVSRTRRALEMGGSR